MKKLRALVMILALAIFVILGVSACGGAASQSQGKESSAAVSKPQEVESSATASKPQVESSTAESTPQEVDSSAAESQSHGEDSSTAQSQPHEKDPSIAILFTNDVHSYYDRDIGYDGLMLMKKELEQQYEHVLLVDAGDAAQGAPLGSLTKGKEPVRIMNEAGYDVAIPGNHEFDYGMDVVDDLAEQLNCGYICCNFCTPDGKTVFDPYKMLTCGDTKVAFVGVDTPTTFSKSGIHDLIDDLGNPMYDFKQDESGEPLVACIQESIDEAREEGADYVILLSHLGDLDTFTTAFRSPVVVSHLKGLDAVIDAHSHQVYNVMVQDAEGKEIPMVQTGSYFKNIGTVILHPDHSISTNLYDEVPAPEDWMEGIEAITVTRKNKERYVEAGMHQFLEDITASYADVMNRKVGEVAFPMIVRDDETGYSKGHNENGLCELVVDAFRESGKSDIGLINAGSVRNELPAGEITFNTVLNVLPYSNDVQVAKMKGQVLLDALEFGVRKTPETNNGFLQVSGLEYTVDLSVETPVKTNEKGNYLGIEGERRVRDVLVNGEPLNPEAEYTVASSSYLLTGGDNFSMFADDAEIIADVGKTDNIVLSEFIENNLHGVVPETYQNTEKRIHLKE